MCARVLERCGLGFWQLCNGRRAVGARGSAPSGSAPGGRHPGSAETETAGKGLPLRLVVARASSTVLAVLVILAQRTGRLHGHWFRAPTLMCTGYSTWPCPCATVVARFGNVDQWTCPGHPGRSPPRHKSEVGGVGGGFKYGRLPWSSRKLTANQNNHLIKSMIRHDNRQPSASCFAYASGHGPEKADRSRTSQ